MDLPQGPGDSAGALPSEMSALLAEWPFRLEQKWTHTGDVQHRWGQTCSVSHFTFVRIA